MTGQLAAAAGEQLPVRVLQSGGGFYLGTTSADGFPFTRESVEYWPSKQDAALALESGAWTQRTDL